MLSRILFIALFAGDQGESIILSEREERVSIYDEKSSVIVSLLGKEIKLTRQYCNDKDESSDWSKSYDLLYW